MVALARLGSEKDGSISKTVREPNVNCKQSAENCGSPVDYIAKSPYSVLDHEKAVNSGCGRVSGRDP